MIPVLIVGGGAAGTLLHLELARRGVPARSIDRLPRAAQTSRAVTIHARTAEIMERLDQRLIDRYLARALPSKGYVLHFVDDSGRRSEVRPGLDFTRLDCRYPRLYVHGQHETENVLREFLLDEYGQATQWGSELVDVEHVEGGARARVQHADGSIEAIDARFIVGCDGGNSRVRRSLRLLQDESDYKGSVMQNLDAFLHDFPDTDEYVHYCTGRGHFVMIVKLPGGYHRLLLSDRGEAAAPEVTPQQGFSRVIDQHFDGVRIGEVVWHSKWESRVRLAHTYRDRNVFLAGDSAHVHSTSGGQGMNCCLQDAWNLGWKLALVLQGRARESLLETYEAERKPIASQVIWAASALHEIFMGHGKSIAERTSRMADPQFLEAVVGRCSGISYNYREQVDQEGEHDLAGGPLPGDRAPDADLADGRRLFAATRGTGYTLLGIPGTAGEPERLAAILDELQRRFAPVLASHLLPAGADLARRYGSGSADRLYLIRPDGYVACRAALENAPAIASHLGRWLA
ncbi:MAG: FAD-dependent monooxygenase [Proteobacteria bacterium]|nr:FAD-dependent monooxygenase [Pseudomonadota bacterium]